MYKQTKSSIYECFAVIYSVGCELECILNSNLLLFIDFQKNTLTKKEGKKERKKDRTLWGKDCVTSQKERLRGGLRFVVLPRSLVGWCGEVMKSRF